MQSVCIIHFANADLAHPVERHLAKVKVASSSLVIRSIFLEIQQVSKNFPTRTGQFAKQIEIVRWTVSMPACVSASAKASRASLVIRSIFFGTIAKR